MNPATAPLAELYRQVGSRETGLTAAEAAERLARHGPNEPPTPRQVGALGQLLSFCLNPLVVVLLVAAAASGVLGDLTNAGIIATVVLLSVAIDFVQSYRSQQAARRLRDTVAGTASVRRDGAWLEIRRRDLVPGDVVHLSAGDMIPADVRLIEARDLHVQQAALTGESMPAEKQAGEIAASPGSLAEAANCACVGASVVSGTATALVVATGRDTAFGEIAARLSARPPETEFERGAHRFGVFIMQTVLALVLLMGVLMIALQRDPLQSLLFAVALAVGLTPEFLPMITTVTLAQGAVHMARRHVIVKHLAAIQDFGSMEILCSDRTGTLTSGQMQLDRALDPLGAPSDRVHLLAYLNSAHETGINSPLDAAILQRACPEAAGYRKLDEIPFDFERRRLSVVVDGGAGPLLVSKGAPESVLAVCTAYETPRGRAELDEAARGRCGEVFGGLSAEGFRVLAVAYRELPVQAAYRVEAERELVLAGFLAFSDPPLDDAAAALAALARDGVRVMILTGDNELVARHVCTGVGLDGESILLGADLESMSEGALEHVAEQTSIFARVSPAQKNRIILALKRRGHVVGYMGDGINDAPSLHSADIGISVAGGVDVAREAADIILLQPGLRVLHQGILEGRRAFANVTKYLLMGTSSNFGNMFSMAGGAIFLPFLPMLPTQILLNNFLYDVAQLTIPTDRVDDASIARPRRWDIGEIRRFMLIIGPISSLYDCLTFGVLMLGFRAGETLFHTGWFVESLVTQTLVLFVIRTAGNPFRSRPSAALTATTLLVAAVAVVLPYTPLAGPLGFGPLPPAFLAFLLVAATTYLGLVEVVKRRLVRRLFG